MFVRTWLLIAAVGLVSACELSESDRIAAACTALCECMVAPLPAVQDQCIAECAAEVDVQLTDECVACISTHDRCATLERDCEPLCNPPEPVFSEPTP